MTETKKKKLVLVVDDQPRVLTFVEIDLKLRGFEVITTVSGEKALEIINARKPDVMLLDMIMPGMSGGQAFDLLKSINPDIKVILSSGYSLNDDAARILKQGCNGFIQKPFDIITLSKKIRSVLESDSHAS